MEPAQWENLKAVFHLALGLSGPQRDAYLSEINSNNPQLGRQLEQMLLADAEAGDFLETNWRAERLAAAYAENDEAALQPDQIIQQRYRIVRLIGSGGMGRVYEAYDCELETHIALKTLREEFLARPDMLQRFRQEVRSAHRVTHPNVCRTYHLERTVIDGGQGPQSITFLTMELLTGVTLREHLWEAGHLAPAQVLLIARKIATGLDAAHQAGIVHRDIKPGNIMLCGPERERVVITDFGLARLNDPADSSRLTTLTGTRNAMGTPAYMAPEQLQGGQITAAVDIYAFGMVLLEMCRPHAPGDAEQTGTTAQRAATDTAFLPAWRAEIEKCLRHDPAQRPQTALEVVDALCLEPRADSMLHASWQRIRTPRFLLSLAIFFSLIMSLFLFPLRLWKRAPATELKSGALIYLAPLQNGTAQTSMDGVSELLKASLSQSTQIDLLDDARAGDILQSMAQKPDAAISPSLGREIAMRAGALRVVFPRLSSSGKEFRLDLEVEQPSETPARPRGHWSAHWTWPPDTEGSGAAGQAVRNAADWLRQLAGESAGDIARLDAPPDDVTTANWSALSDYAMAERLFAQTKREEAVAALQSAVAKDSHFALAYALLGDILVNIGRREEGFRAYASALDSALGERLSLRERTRIKGLVGQDTGDLQAAEAAYREYTLYYPRDYIGWFRRGLPLYSMGRIAESIQVLEKAHSVAPSKPIPLNQLALAYLVLGNQARVDGMLADLQANFPRGYYLFTLVPVQVTRGQYAAAAETIGEMGHSTKPVLDFAQAYMAANLQAEQGDYAAADSTLTSRLDHVPEDSMSLVQRAHVRCRTGQFANCISDLKAALRADPSAAVTMNASVVLGQGIPLAAGKDKAMLIEVLAELSRRTLSPYDGLSAEIAQHRLKGEFLLANGQVREAVEQFRVASALDPSTELREPLARSLEAYAARQTDSAASTHLLTEALDLRLPFAETPARLWVYSQIYPPGAYADNLQASIRLRHNLGNSSRSDLMEKLHRIRKPVVL